MQISIYPGSFDPFTEGHLDIVKKALLISDKLYIVVTNNSSKKHMFTLEERAQMILDATKDLDLSDSKQVVILSFQGIISNLAKKLNAQLMIRGLRNHVDLSYELDIEPFTKATLPRAVTVYFTAEKEHIDTSSSLVRNFVISNNVEQAEKVIPMPARYLFRRLALQRINYELSQDTSFTLISSSDVKGS